MNFCCGPRYRSLFFFVGLTKRALFRPLTRARRPAHVGTHPFPPWPFFNLCDPGWCQKIYNGRHIVSGTLLYMSANGRPRNFPLLSYHPFPKSILLKNYTSIQMGLAIPGFSCQAHTYTAVDWTSFLLFRPIRCYVSSIPYGRHKYTAPTPFRHKDCNNLLLLQEDPGTLFLIPIFFVGSPLARHKPPRRSFHAACNAPLICSGLRFGFPFPRLLRSLNPEGRHTCCFFSSPCI